MIKFRKLVDKYAYLVSHHPYILLIIVILISALAVYAAGTVTTKSSDDRDMIPHTYEVIKAFDIIEDSFGGSESIMIVVEIDPEYISSGEARDIRDPEVISYINLLTGMSEHVDDVVMVSSASSVMRSLNGGVLPKSRNQINSLVDRSSTLSNYVSKDYTLSRISIMLSDTYVEGDIVRDLQEVIDQVPSPPGLKTQLAGDVATGPVIEESIGPDMARTSRFSMIGIIIILFILFASVRYALTPLSVIGIGILWTFGYLGLTGMNISSSTSGAISMIMGIGIDFGIQTITRFRQELKDNDPEKAMANTLSNVFIPMATTTLAALIGFKAMSMGDLSVLQELATIMSYGIAACFLAAITVVPVIAVLGEKFMINVKTRRAENGKKRDKRDDKNDDKKKKSGGRKR